MFKLLVSSAISTKHDNCKYSLVAFSKPVAGLKFAHCESALSLEEHAYHPLADPCPRIGSRVILCL
jgi:hypothetical protein